MPILLLFFILPDGYPSDVINFSGHCSSDRNPMCPKDSNGSVSIIHHCPLCPIDNNCNDGFKVNNGCVLNQMGVHQIIG